MSREAMKIKTRSVGWPPSALMGTCERPMDALAREHLQRVALLECLCRCTRGDSATRRRVLPSSFGEPHRVHVDAVLQWGFTI